jgi:hypothetical protein
MRHLFLLTLCFLATARMAQAQCNTKEYTRIFNEASALQERGAFIDAKNRFEAAKIYACNKKQQDEAEEKIDALFEQIDRLRETALAARYTADSALQRIAAVLDKINFYQNKFGLSYDSQTKKYGFIDKNLQTHIEFKYDAALPFDYTGYAWVKFGASRRMKSMENGYYYLIDTVGNEYLLETHFSTENFRLDDQRVRALDLRHKQLEQLRLEGTLPKLEILLLGDNQLQSIPTEIFQLDQLKTLDLSVNDLSNLPSEIWSLHSLESLFLHFNNLRSISEAVSRLENLKTLDLSDNQIETLPISLFSLRKLQSLDLSSNQLQQLPTEIKQMIGLKRLDLSNNPLSIATIGQLQLDMPWCVIKY